MAFHASRSGKHSHFGCSRRSKHSHFGRFKRQPAVSRFWLRRDAVSLYHKYFFGRKERQLFSTIGFVGGFGVVRAITHSIRDNKGPFRNISPGGKHIHHMTFGIMGLLAIGYLWMLEFGTGPNCRSSRMTSLFYGIGAALTLDEFALWLNLEDDYWTKQGRESVDAVMVFTSLLVLSFLSQGAVREAVLTARASPQRRALLQLRRWLLHHPDSPLHQVVVRQRALARARHRY